LPGLILAVWVIAAGCAAPQPTPYQPLQDSGGYEETRLQEDMYRVSFRGNRYTAEQDVIDLLYLRCAELTLDAGYSHFEVVADYGSLQFRATPYHRDEPPAGPGMRSGFRSSFWIGTGPPGYDPVYVAEPHDRLAMFVIRMSKGGEVPPPAGTGGSFLDARYLADSLAPKKQPRLPAE
jgi:hypothetical protein